jgi:hypothetical protein
MANATDEGGDGALRPLMARCPPFFGAFEWRILEKADTEIRFDATIFAGVRDGNGNDNLQNGSC